MPYPTFLNIVESDVRAEIARQDEKWGEQNHADGTGAGVVLLSAMTYPTMTEMADKMRQICQDADDDGSVDWLKIALEEVFEAAAESDQAKLRTEVIQCAAVFMQWAASIDRR